MVLSEAEAEAQLAALRRQRDALDRTITDLTLYLELGRRLKAAPASAADEPPPATAFASKPGPWPSPDTAERAEPETRDDEASPERKPPLAAQPRSGPVPPPERAATANAPGMRTGVVRPPDQAPADGALSEGVLARRYGRALIEAALAALDEAGRPLHASEILAVLAGRGFSLPGHDPVAALNTRLWKRSAPGGPLKRMGDAVYALVEPGDEG